jgi:hypothetical protein
MEILFSSFVYTIYGFQQKDCFFFSYSGVCYRINYDNNEHFNNVTKAVVSILFFK